MSSLLASWHNELEKLWLKKSTKAMLGLAVLVPLLLTLLTGLLTNAAGLGAALSGQAALLTLNLFTGILLPLYLAMSAADLFAGETAARTIKLALVRPVTRTKLFASKVLALAAFTAIILAAAWLASSVCGLLAGSADPLAEWVESTITYAVSVIPMLVVCLAAVWIAQYFAGSAAALGCAVLIYLAGKLLPLFYPPLALWSLYSYTDWHLLWGGDGAPAATLLSSFFILLAYSMMAYIGGLATFERKSF